MGIALADHREYANLQALESGKLQKRPPQDVLMGALTGGLEGIADSPISFEPRLMTWLPGTCHSVLAL